MKNLSLTTIKRPTLLAAIYCLLCCFSTFAAFNVYEFTNSEQEKKFATLIDELRCPKCQNNDLSDSNAPLATDIKNYVYQSVKSGQSNQEITDFLISRYGQFITYKPSNTWIWLLPTIIGAVAGMITVIVIARNRRKKYHQDNKVMTTPDMKTIIEQYEKNNQ